jgi:serine phosphatase RsbU (regulator of sigma subunit)
MVSILKTFSPFSILHRLNYSIPEPFKGCIVNSGCSLMKKTRLYILLYLFCYSMQTGLAQSGRYTTTPKIDSLKKVLSACKEDSTAINTLNLLSQEYIDMGRYSMSDSLAREALKLADKTGYKHGKGESYNKLGIRYMFTGENMVARDYFMKALLCDEQACNIVYICRRLRNISITYCLEGKFSLAISYSNKGLKLAEQYHLPQEVAGCYNSLAFTYVALNNYDLALQHFSKALQLNKNPVDKNVNYASYKGIADVYRIRGDAYQALIGNLNALNIARALNSKQKITYCLTSVANVYSNMSNTSKAMEYWFKALKMAEETESRMEIAIALSSIGETYLDLKDYDHSLSYLLRGTDVSKTLDNKSFLANNFNILALLYLTKKDTATSMMYSYKSIKLCEALSLKSFINPALNNLGKIYEAKAIQQVNKDSVQLYRTRALDYYKESLKISQESGQKRNLMISNFLLGSFYFNQKEITKAKAYLNGALKLSVETGEIFMRKDIYRLLSELCGSQQQLKLEHTYYKEYIALRDTIFNLESAKKVLRSEMNFEYEKKLSLERAEQDKKNAMVALEQKRQKTILWSIFAIALVFFSASLFAYYNYLQKLKINKELKLRNERIEIARKIIAEKNNEITDSINYALHIQQAILPDKEEFFKILSKSFILFKPKDIVSGDFYFFSIAHNKIYIAAADCTGHGVPGGFMSMIGSEKLSNALKENSKPGRILTALNKSIKASFQQSEVKSKLHDGMDISLCAIDLITNSIEFAGANRPLWIIRKDSTSLEEIKGTIASIGGYTDDNTCFETHSIQLRQGDTIYLCSDGYSDQFGASGKKFMTKRLKTMLMDIQDKSLAEQNKYLEEAHMNWRGDEQQTDDILLIGLRL